jgi:hypothetical protein
VTDRDRAGQPPSPRSRLEDEVLEILVRADQPTSIQDHLRRKAERARMAAAPRGANPFRSPSLSRIGPGGFLIGAFVLAFLATLVRSASPLLATLFVLAALASFAMLWVRRYAAPAGSDAKRWRGRDLDLSPPPPAWLESLRDRFRRPPRF